MNISFQGLVFGLAALCVGCGSDDTPQLSLTAAFSTEQESGQDNADSGRDDSDVSIGDTEELSSSAHHEDLCDGEFISSEAVDEMVTLTEVTDHETIYSTFNRIDRIAALFEACGDPWGMFPTTYRHITRRIIQAIETGEIEDGDWGRRIVLDFAGRYLANLKAALTGGNPSYGWEHYYYLADRDDVSRTRAVVVAMVVHLTLDLPYSLVEVETTDDHADDYFVLGELMIEITPDFIADLLDYYDTDAEDILNGFFLGDWIDGVFGQDTTITLSYQTIRTKSWNNRWLLEQSWGSVIAAGEIYAAFWAMDGVLATLDATNKI